LALPDLTKRLQSTTDEIGIASAQFASLSSENNSGATSLQKKLEHCQAASSDLKSKQRDLKDLNTSTTRSQSEADAELRAFSDKMKEREATQNGIATRDQSLAAVHARVGAVVSGATSEIAALQAVVRGFGSNSPWIAGRAFSVLVTHQGRPMALAAVTNRQYLHSSSRDLVLEAPDPGRREQLFVTGARDRRTVIHSVALSAYVWDIAMGGGIYDQPDGRILQLYGQEHGGSNQHFTFQNGKFQSHWNRGLYVTYAGGQYTFRVKPLAASNPAQVFTIVYKRG
jgi:hypothetical protein